MNGRWLRLVWVVAMTSACSWFDGDDGAKQGPDGGLGDQCASNAECAAAFVCAGGACQLAGSVGLGGSCWATRDCDEGLFCSPQGICAPAGAGDVGDSCVTAAECRRGLICDVFGFGGSCAEAGDSDVGGACSRNADCVAGLVCSPSSDCKHPSVAYPPFTGVTCEPSEDVFKVYFEVPTSEQPLADFYRLPFPNDARVDASGALYMDDFPRPGQSLLGIDIVDLYVDALVADFAGFSAVAPVSFRFSSELQFDTVSGDSVHYIDITPGAEQFGNDRLRSWSYDSGQRLYNCQNFFTVANAAHEPLLSGHTYAVYLTTDIRGADGSVPVHDTDFAALLGDTRPAGNLGEAWDRYAPFRAYLGDPNIDIDPATIAGATVFTVQDLTGRAERLAVAAQASAPPQLKELTLCDGANTSPCEDATGRGACSAPSDDYYEIHGRFTVPIFQDGTPPYERPEDGGGLVEADGSFQSFGAQDVCFAMTIPKSPAPVGGFPFVVEAHGTGGAFNGAVLTGEARALATASTPTALFSYDGVVHGDRRNGSTRDPDSLMFNIGNPRSARDNNLQGGVDVLQALRVPGLSPIDLPGAGETTLAASKVYFMGHSQGSNVGIPAIASSDAVSAAIFSGAGAHLTRGILTKTSPVDAKTSLEFLIGEELGTSHPVMVIWQTFFDSVDTLYYGKRLLRDPAVGISSKHVFMSWGTGDTFSPQPTLNAMAKVTGLPVVEPAIENLDTGLVSRPVSQNVLAGDGSQRTAACFQYPPDGYDGHFVALRNPQAVADWLAFLMSTIETGTPAVQ